MQVCFIGLLPFIFSRSAPEIGSLQRNSLLRKTHSHPQSKPPTPPPPQSLNQEAAKNLRSIRSVPSPLTPTSDSKKSIEDLNHKASTPSSPTVRENPLEKSKLENRKSTASTTSSSSGSPKARRTIFDGMRNTLRQKKDGKNRVVVDMHGSDPSQDSDTSTDARSSDTDFRNPSSKQSSTDSQSDIDQSPVSSQSPSSELFAFSKICK